MTPEQADLAIVNAVVDAPSMYACIASMEHPDPKQRRGIDFGAIDRAMAVTERWVVEVGPDAVVEGAHGRTASGLRTTVRHVAEAAEPFRPKVRRA